MRDEEELIRQIRALAGFDPVEQARKEKVTDIGNWIERKIGKKLREDGEMTEGELEALTDVIHRGLFPDEHE